MTISFSKSSLRNKLAYNAGVAGVPWKSPSTFLHSFETLSDGCKNNLCLLCHPLQTVLLFRLSPCSFPFLFCSLTLGCISLLLYEWIDSFLLPTLVKYGRGRDKDLTLLWNISVLPLVLAPLILENWSCVSPFETRKKKHIRRCLEYRVKLCS